MARRGFDPELQLQRDMIELGGYPVFWRFLFTVAQKSGIGATTYGTNIDASLMEGRRSLGIELLRLADDALAVRDPATSPFNALAKATLEAFNAQLQQAQGKTHDEDEDEDEAPDRR